MKKAFFTLAAVLAFGIAQAQTDTTSMKPAKTERSASKPAKTKTKTDNKSTNQNDAAMPDKTIDKRKKNTNPATSPTAPATPGTGSGTTPTN